MQTDADDRQRRRTPVIATAPATGHPRLQTSKAVTVLFPCPAHHPASRVGKSHTLHGSQHEAYCRPNLGDILDTRLPRNLILKLEKKCRDSSRSRLVNIPNTMYAEQHLSQQTNPWLYFSSDFFSFWLLPVQLHHHYLHLLLQ